MAVGSFPPIHVSLGDGTFVFTFHHMQISAPAERSQLRAHPSESKQDGYGVEEMHSRGKSKRANDAEFG